MRGPPGAWHQKPGKKTLLGTKGIKMLGKIKKVFFSGVFGVLYISFVGQLIYILGWVDSIEDKMKLLALLSVDWLVLIAARYF